jgi:acylphosphatase
VQGVGFRDWLVRTARAQGVNGWVRNKGRNQVEAVLSGPETAVHDVISACRNGPPLAVVEDILSTPYPPPGAKDFTCLPSAL